MEMLTAVLLGAVVILQIITISIVSANKKHKRYNHEFKHQRNQNGDNKKERKDGDFRRGANNNNNRKVQHENKGARPQQSNAPAQQTSQVTIDPMEKSLRDINLKLKNAEREQESARKKITDYSSKDGRPQRQGGNGGNNNSNRKNNRDRNFNRAEQRKENWQEKQNSMVSDEPVLESVSAMPAASAAPEYENENLHTVSVPVTETAAVSVTESVTQVTNADTAVSAEGEFEHGRKFVAKRRHLQESGTAETETSSITSENTTETQAAEQLPEETEMKFGRR